MANQSINENTSLQLTLLKLLAMIGVVNIHACILYLDFFVITPEKLPVVYYVQTIFSQYISRVAVPVFFAVSGYIYFAKQYQDSNWQFLRRKAKGILWPYLLWNSIALFYIFLAQIPDFTGKYFTGHIIISKFTPARWLDSYIGFGDSWYPFLYTLWFLPYLFAAFMAVHIFRKYFCKYEWLIWGIALLNIVCSSLTPLKNHLTEWGPFLRLLYAISFFSMGALLLKYKNIVSSRPALFISGVFFAAATVLSLTWSMPGIKLNPLSFYAGLIFIFSLTARVGDCREKTKKIIVFLSGFSFLIYVTHEFAMTALTKIIYPLIPAETWCILLLYFLIPVTLMTLLITGGWVLKKLLPGVFDFLFNAR